MLMANKKTNKGTYECNLELKDKTVVLTFKASSVGLAMKLFAVLGQVVNQLQRDSNN